MNQPESGKNRRKDHHKINEKKSSKLNSTSISRISSKTKKQASASQSR